MTEREVSAVFNWRHVEIALTPGEERSIECETLVVTHALAYITDADLCSRVNAWLIDRRLPEARWCAPTCPIPEYAYIVLQRKLPGGDAWLEDGQLQLVEAIDGYNQLRRVEKLPGFADLSTALRGAAGLVSADGAASGAIVDLVSFKLEQLLNSAEKLTAFDKISAVFSRGDVISLRLVDRPVVFGSGAADGGDSADIPCRIVLRALAKTQLSTAEAAAVLERKQ